MSQGFDVESFVYRYFSQVIPTTNSSGQREFRVDCINGCSEKKFYINAKSGRAQCFKCGLSFKSLFKLIQGITGASNGEVMQIIRDGATMEASLDGLSFEQRILEKLYPYKPAHEPCEMPKEAERVYGSKTLIAKRAMKWLLGRGLSKEDIKYYNIYVCGYGDYKNRVILPIYQSGELVYFNARTMSKNNLLKVKNPPKDGNYVGKSEIVFNIERASQYKTGVLVEGFFDAVVGGPNFMALMGKFLSETQLYQILLADFDELIVMFDPDAHEYTIKAAETLSLYMPVKVVLLTDDDPADLGREECWNYLVNAQPFDWQLGLELAI